MSLYNLVNGVNPCAFYVLPMLGKHPDEYPRFRDCFTGDEEHPEYDDNILVYTRVGGGNREDYEDEISKLRNTDGYVTDYDDSFDCTFATFVFKVPEKFKDDFQKFKDGKIKDFSSDYKTQMYKVYPRLKEKFDELFAK